MTASLILAVILSASSQACPSSIPGIEELAQPHSRVVLGGLAGNEQTPALLGALACHSVGRGPVRVALELPLEEQERVDAYLRGGHTTSLLASKSWSGAQQSGTTSRAVLALLESLRTRRARGADVKVLVLGSSGSDVSARLAAAVRAEPEASFFALVDVARARRSAVAMGGQVYDVRYGLGSNWSCADEDPQSCLPRPIGQPGIGASRVELKRSADGSLAGFIDLAKPSVSAPAGARPTGTQAAASVRLARLDQARADLQRGRFAACAEAYKQLVAEYENEADEAVRYLAWEGAACHAGTGSADAALSMLTRAAIDGFDDPALLQGPTFAPLRSHARWEATVERVRIAPTLRNAALRETLVKMGEADQRELQLGLQGRQDGKANQDVVRVALLKQMMAEGGWPRISAVGLDGSVGAWLVAQHADLDLAFQQQALGAMAPAWKEHEVTGLAWAYLSDRVAAAQGRPQPFGTQGSPVYGERERAAVEARRREVGLPSMAQMARLKAELYESDTRSPQ